MLPIDRCGVPGSICTPKNYETKISNEIAQMSSLTRAYTRQAHIPQLTSLGVKHLCRSILLTFPHKCLLTNQTDRRLLWNASTKTLLNNNRHYTYLYTGINVCVVAVINLGGCQSRMLSNKAITLSHCVYRNKW